MPALHEVTDLDLMEQGLTSLDEIERDGSVVAGIRCLILNEDVKLEIRHDWSGPFMAPDHDRRGEEILSEVQLCYRCGAARRATFGPYLGCLAIPVLTGEIRELRGLAGEGDLDGPD